MLKLDLSLTRKQTLWEKLRSDQIITISIFLLFLFGALVLYSAKSDKNILDRQLLRVVLSCILMFGIAQVPSRVYHSLAPWLYLFSLIMLLLVLVIGDVAKGAQRWLSLGFIKFQPAEIMKIALPLMTARYLDGYALPPTFITLLLPLFFIITPVILIALQPDLGTAILVASSGFFVLFFAGISWRLMFSAVVLSCISAPIFWFMLHDYQRQRILTLLNPEHDPLGKGYHIIQSKIAIGSGGLYGKGWLNGTQSHLDFIPERTTDSIFAVLAEEFGLIGVLCLLSIYLIIIMRGLYIGIQAKNTFSRLLAGSITMTFFVYVFVNIGMVSGILPVVGIPLPLVSYGGTSMLTIMVSFGILMGLKNERTSPLK